MDFIFDSIGDKIVNDIELEKAYDTLIITVVGIIYIAYHM